MIPTGIPYISTVSVVPKDHRAVVIHPESSSEKQQSSKTLEEPPSTITWGVWQTAQGSRAVSTVGHEHTRDRGTEALVQCNRAATCSCLLQTINQTSELSVGTTLANISSQPRSGKVKRVHNQQGTSTSQTSSSHIDSKEPPEVSLRTVLGEQVLDGVLQNIPMFPQQA